MIRVLFVFSQLIVLSGIALSVYEAYLDCENLKLYLSIAIFLATLTIILISNHLLFHELLVHQIKENLKKLFFIETNENAINALNQACNVTNKVHEKVIIKFMKNDLPKISNETIEPHLRRGINRTSMFDAVAYRLSMLFYTKSKAYEQFIKSTVNKDFKFTEDQILIIVISYFSLYCSKNNKIEEVDFIVETFKKTISSQSKKEKAVIKLYVALIGSLIGNKKDNIATTIKNNEVFFNTLLQEDFFRKYIQYKKETRSEYGCIKNSDDNSLIDEEFQRLESET